MVTREEIEAKGLKNGSDYLTMAKVRYKVGDKFYIGDREASVKKIIDEVHFLSDRNECLHTFMFHTSHWRHGKNMIPLELDYDAIEKAERRIQNGEDFHTEIVVANGRDKTCYKENLRIYYDREKDKFVKREGLTDERAYSNLVQALSTYSGNNRDGDDELFFVLQDWGETGENHKETLIAKDYETVNYDGIDNDLLLTAPLKSDRTQKVSLLKKHCAPSQSFVLVKNLHKDFESGDVLGETVWEANDFKEISDVMVDIAEAAKKEAEAE